MESRMDVLLWKADAKVWETISHDDWMGFRGFGTERKRLSNIGAGGHHFVVLVIDDGEIVNLIRHKYLSDENGMLVDENVYELTDQENKDWSRFMVSQTMSDNEQQRLREIQRKASKVLVLSNEAFRSLKTALPLPIKLGSAAQEFMRGGGQSGD